MKVYFVYDGKDAIGATVRTVENPFKLKIDIPNSWFEGPCSRLCEFFVKTYNGKFPENVLNADELEMKCGGIVLGNKEAISKQVREYNDIYFLHKLASVTRQAREGELLCTNYGCGKYFLEEENNDTACHCHALGPVFHDLEKHWACCPDKKAFDWEAFQKIPTCQVRRHDVKNRVVFHKEEITNQPLTDQQVARHTDGCAVDASGPRKTGPREFEEAMFTQNLPQEIIDGKARCRNFGCTKEFVVAENNDTACHYHTGGPVFWDTYKYWKCCPDKKCLEFDDFVKIPGCVTGPHKL